MHHWGIPRRCTTLVSACREMVAGNTTWMALALAVSCPAVESNPAGSLLFVIAKGGGYRRSVMARVAFVLCLALALLGDVNGNADVRLVDAAGSLSNVGLLQVRMDAAFGTVCGANAAAADVTLHN